MEKQKILKNMLNITMIFASLSILGIFNFAVFSFEWQRLTEPAYWSAVILKTITLILLFNTGINLFFDKNKDENTQLRKAVEEYQQKNKLRDIDFDDWVNSVFNKSLKIEAYKIKMQKKLYRLTKHRHYNIDKKNEILKQLDPQYIEENIEYIRVKYKKVLPAAFSMSIDGSTKSNDMHIFSNEMLNRGKKTVSNIISMVLISALTTALIFTNSEVIVINAVLQSILYILFGLWQMLQGILYCPKMIQEEYMLPVQNRNKILDKYIEYENNIETSKAKKISNYIQQNEEEQK